jgi:hypothetical protein
MHSGFQKQADGGMIRVFVFTMYDEAKQGRLVSASNRDTVSLAAVPAHGPKNDHSAGSSLAPCLADNAQPMRPCLAMRFGRCERA